MKSKLTRPPGLFFKTGVMAFFIMALTWLPQANAAMTAGTVIENVATVSWEDGQAVPVTYTDTAYTQVTINLVPAAVTLSGRPTNNPGDEGDKAATPIGQTVLTGSTATYLYAVTANSNGSAVYNFVTPNTGADGHGRDPGGDVNVTATPTVNWNLMDPDGVTTSGAADPASVTLGSAIVTTVVSDTQLRFPGGTVDDFAINDIVVINGYDYRVSAITYGNAPDHGNLPLPLTETQATVTFAANASGFATAPLFQTGGAGLTVAVGDIVGEQQLFRVTVTATVNPANQTGTVRHDVYLESAIGALNTQLQDTDTTFEPLPTVTITKDVRNVTLGETFATSTGTGNAGDILEYRVTVSNSGSTAEAVVVTDPIPAYTTLVTHSATNYGAADGGTIFAEVTDTNGTGTSVELTITNADDEDTARASGDASAGTAAGDPLSFYIGGRTINTTTNGTQGGDVRDSVSNPSDVFVILYQVQIDNL